MLPTNRHTNKRRWKQNFAFGRIGKNITENIDVFFQSYHCFLGFFNGIQEIKITTANKIKGNKRATDYIANIYFTM